MALADWSHKLHAGKLPSESRQFSGFHVLTTRCNRHHGLN